MNDKVLVVGAAGLLGSSLSPHLERAGFVVVRHGLTAAAVQVRFDLNDAVRTHEALEAIQPDVIVNLAALTNVDLCEAEPHQAYLGNVCGVENLSRWILARGRGCFLLHISTDHLYDGPGPHREEDIHLTNYYAFSKYTAESMVARVGGVVLRTNFFGRSLSSRRKSFSDWVVESLTERKPIHAVHDILFSPLSLPTLVEHIEAVIRRRAAGLFNLGSRDGFSKADFIFKLANTLQLATDQVSLIESGRLFTKTYRPKDMRMDVGRFEDHFGVELPSLESEIRRMKEYYHVCP
ncbi:MAG: SDR family oxidoreductase [Magnetococcales bacterium]|nr:SDR family oxidoreductase [Magnetococcales bacterium]